MSQKLSNEELPRPTLYILGAGFSCAAGLPLGPELSSEVMRRARMIDKSSRMYKINDDVIEYISFKRCCDDMLLTEDGIDFEDFIGFLDIEHHLRLRGSGTWSEEGNEGQITAKILLGQIIAQKTPSASKVPDIYLRFARKLRPYDIIVTFNYDVLLERALEAEGVRYRLAPYHYSDPHLLSCVQDANLETEVVLLKMHGSIDWFDRSSFIKEQIELIERGYSASDAKHPIFGRQNWYKITKPIFRGPYPLDHPLSDIYRLINVDQFYNNPPYFMATPVLISPSTKKVVYTKIFSEFWGSIARWGHSFLRFVIIGYSLPEHDEYARQAIYRLVTDYQQTPTDVIFPYKVDRDRLMIVDLKKEDAIEDFKRRYRFVDWSKTDLFLEGFTDEFVQRL
jgi:hypothetical protein